MVIKTNVKLMLTGELLRIRPIPHRNCKKYTEREKLEEREADQSVDGVLRWQKCCG